MFTGIVTDVGTVRKAEQRGDLRLQVATGYDLATIDLGASISCSGVCLTVVDKGDKWFAVDVSGETVSRTAADHWKEGAKLNLERSLRMGDELGGHIVTGHVDAVAAVTETSPDGGSNRLTIHAPPQLAKFIAAKGSIAVDGVSLTVNEIDDRPDGSVCFGINVIPHTSDVTTLGEIEQGAHVNLEIDTVARYLQRLESLRTI
jgi:riboflavin synthase